MASASSSSGFMPNALRKYNVFISFRGEDTCNNFTSHLYAALKRASLEVFRDDKQLEKGDEIAPSLIQAIKDSSVSIVVFSENYASSKWCLDELAHIMQCRKDEGQYVIPIFYKVDPSHVRKQTGAYEKAFEEHVSKHDHDKVTRWKVALSEAGDLSGSHCDTFKDESNIIEEIVANIMTKLERIDNSQGTSMDVVGIDEMTKPIEELLKKSHKVGIWGMGGVGKTTTAKAVFDTLSSQYNHRCFLENVREETDKKGSKHVLDSLVSQLLGQDMQSNSSIGSITERRLGSEKALVVLDDVATSEQLEDLQDKGEKEVEGIMLDTLESRGALELTAKTFNKMTRLRFLKIHFFWACLSHVDRIIPISLESISNEIRYFHWECCPMKSLPSNFCAKHLLELNLGGSLVETLWEGVQDLANLGRLNLPGCSNLKELPDFSKASRLESVDLRDCKSLRYVPESLLSLHSLMYLDVSECISLESLQSRIHLKSLEEINTLGCFDLKKFSVSSEELTHLDLSLTNIEELSPSIGRCSKLTTLSLPEDTVLKNYPIKVLSCLTLLTKLRISVLNIDNVDLRVLFDRLLGLRSLSLRKCRNLTELPDNITQLSSLEKLRLGEWPHLAKLPDMRHLSKLQHLSVAGCTALHSLPELPPSLRRLNAGDCVTLDLNAIEEQVKLLLEKAVHEKEDVQVCYPGKKVPEWFGNNRSQNDTLKLCLSSHTLVGFVFCAVTPVFVDDKLLLCIDSSVEEDEMTEEVKFPTLTDLSSGNVVLRSCPEASEWILEKIEGNKRNHDATTYNSNLSFELILSTEYFDDSPPTEECGVYPIFALGNSELNSNSRKRKAVMIFGVEF